MNFDNKNDENLEIVNKLNKRDIKSEIYHSVSDSTSVVFENNNFKKIESKSVQGKGLRVIKNKKLGFAYSSGYDHSKIEEFACENSSFGNKVEFDFPNKKTDNKVKLYYKNVYDIPIEKMKGIGQEITDKINAELNDYNVSVDVEKEKSWINIVNSSGFNNSFQKSYFSISFSAMRAKDDEIFNSYESAISLNSEIDYKQKVKDFIYKLKLLDKKAKINSGKYTVIFTPKAAGLLYNILSFSLNGKNIQKGASLLSNKKGEKIFSDNFSLMDAAQYEGGISSVPFDGEGMPSHNKYLVENGVVSNFVYDIFTASLMEEQSTGNGRRGYSSVPSPGFYNFVIEPGEVNHEDLIKELDEGILVDEFIGGGQSNVMAGEFSVNLTLAYKIENGEITGALKDTMLSGNIFNAFSFSPAFSKDVYQRANIFTPYLMLNNISVSS